MSAEPPLPSFPPPPAPIREAGVEAPWAPIPASAPPRPFQNRWWLHILLLLLTIATTTQAGIKFYLSFLSDFGYKPVHVTLAQAFVGALSFSLPSLAILGSHEMGHYLACRYYGIDASLPYFLPMPTSLFGIPLPLSLFGTLGAVIRIRAPIPTKRMLFDIGVAGPIAGFIVAVPTLILGVHWSHVARLPPRLDGMVNFGDPLIVRVLQFLQFGAVPDGYSVNGHPMVFASLFGLLATALNLLPVGQLDGGHIAYANLGSKARFVTIGTLIIMLILGMTTAPSWLFWCVLISLLLFMTGWEHPQTLDDHVPLDRRRVIVTIIAILIFIACFTPAPITLSELSPGHR